MSQIKAGIEINLQDSCHIFCLKIILNFRYYGTNKVMASIVRHDKTDAQAEEKLFRLEDFPVHEKLEKFMEDVK